jgi:hypothetical protein
MTVQDVDGGEIQRGRASRFCPAHGDSSSQGVNSAAQSFRFAEKPALLLTARALPLRMPSGMIAATEIEAAANAAD